MTHSTHEISIAGLLHDIGKLYQRAYGPQPPPDYGEVGRTHQDYTAYFVRNVLGLGEELAESARRHHLARGTPERLRPRPDRPLDWIVYHADNYASRERAKDDRDTRKAVKRTPLASIFSQVQVQGVGAEGRAYPFLPGGKPGFGPARAFPVNPSKSNVRPEAYLRLVEHLEAGVEKLAKVKEQDALLANLNMLFLDALWPVPADTRGDPGISLYDHLRLTAAFAAALWSYHQRGTLDVSAIRDEKPDKFLLAGGDLSGIQGHIYRIKEAQGQGGIAKRLRARSLEVSLAAEAMALGLLDRLGLPPIQRLMSAGGKFYLLLPNAQEVEEALREHRERWEAWAIGQGVSLVPVLDAVAFSPKDLQEEGFSAIFKKLAAAMARAKLRPLASQVARFKDPFVDRGGRGKRPCAVCGVRPALADEPGSTCVECARDRQVGALLPRAVSLSATTRPDKPYYRFPELSFDLGSRGYVLRGRADFTPAPYPWELRPLLGHLPVVADALDYQSWDLDGYRSFLEANGLAPEEDEALSEGKPLTFGELAHLSDGAPYLGALMLDADRMGEAFAGGFDHLSEAQSPGRLAALSRAVEAFFTLEISGLVKDAGRYRDLLGWKELEARQKSRRYRLVYTVYSGGDDLFLIGPWDVLLDFARDLNRLYRRYTHHPAFTLSGGFALLRPTTPVPMIYEAVRRAEERAKERGKDPTSPTQGKGHLALFGEVVAWEDLEALAGWAGWLRDELRAGRFSSALAYRLLGLFRRYAAEGDPARKMFYKPQLAYALRNYADEEKFPGYRERLALLLDHARPEWAHLPVWVEWGLYGARGGKG